MSESLVGRRGMEDQWEPEDMSMNAISDRQLPPGSACGSGGNGRVFERTHGHRNMIRKGMNEKISGRNHESNSACRRKRWQRPVWGGARARWEGNGGRHCDEEVDNDL